MASKLLALARSLRGPLSSSQLMQSGSVSFEATNAGRLLGSFMGVRGLATSSASHGAASSENALVEPTRKFRPLNDKELWHEAWMYEDRFGSETDPVVVPSLEPERIIGVTDPDDENLVVWGIVRENDPPRQFIEGGEFYVLKKVPYIKKVGDVLDELEGAGAGAPIPH